MPKPVNFDETYILDWVRKKLGEPVVCVEIDDTQLKYLIDDVIELFQKYRPKQLIQGEFISKGVYEATPPDDNLGLLDIDHSAQQRLDNMSVEAALMYDPFYFISSGAIGGLDVILYDQTRRWMEVVGRVFSAEFEYEMTDQGLFFYLPYNAKVKFIWAMPYDGLSDIPREYQQLFLNLVLAKARQTLGAIRGKYSGVPAAGGMMQLDGEWLREKGAQDEERYLDELMRISPHYIPSYG